VLLLTLVIVGSIQIVSALSIHYELDKQYYHPGDTGRLLLACKSEAMDSDKLIFGAEMNITGIGIFRWNMTGLPEAQDLPPGIHGYLLRKDQGANIEIYFKILDDAQPGQYRYTWAIYMQMLFKQASTLTMLAAGEVPQSQPLQSLNPFLLLLIALPILLIAYPAVRWKSRKAAKLVALGIIALLASGLVLGGFLFVYLIFAFLTASYPFLILLILAIILVSVIRRRRGSKRTAKAQKL
jgi:hypothetical protein